MFEKISRNNPIFDCLAFKKDALCLNTMSSILANEQRYPDITIFSNNQNCVILNSDPMHGLIVWTADDFKDWGALFDFITKTFHHLPKTILSKKDVWDAAVQNGFFEDKEALVLGVYKLSDLKPIEYHGKPRLVQKNDVPYVVELLKIFEKDSGCAQVNIEQKALSFVDSDNACLWVDPAGQIVSLGNIAFSEKYGRIGSVVTKREDRGKGYAKMLVHHLAQKILDKQKIPMIYTDLNYASSNICYQAVGFVFQQTIAEFSYKEK